MQYCSITLELLQFLVYNKNNTSIQHTPLQQQILTIRTNYNLFILAKESANRTPDSLFISIINGAVSVGTMCQLSRCHVTHIQFKLMLTERAHMVPTILLLQQHQISIDQRYKILVIICPSLLISRFKTISFSLYFCYLFNVNDTFLLCYKTQQE